MAVNGSAFALLMGASALWLSLPDIALAQTAAVTTPTAGQARDRAAAVRSTIEDLKGGSYIEAAIRKAEEASRAFAIDGEASLAAEFALEAVNLCAGTENWRHVEAEYFPRYLRIVADLDKIDSRKGDAFMGLMVQLKSAIEDRAGRQKIADALLERARSEGGAQGERGLNAEYLIAFAWMQSDGQEGFDKLNAMLASVEKTDLDSFTIRNYTEAAKQFINGGYNDIADELLNRALLTEAAKRAPQELGDTYLRLAMLKETMGDQQNAFRLYVQAVNTLDARFGRESLEQLYASDKFAVFTSRVGSPASSTARSEEIYKLGLKTLGEDHHETWKFANNYADMLREIGASAQAIDLDAFVMAKRIAKYGPNHFNVLVSANNMGQTFLNLGRYKEARKYFQQNRDIAVALGRHDADYVGQADGWLLYADLASGAVAMDDRQAQAMEAIAASGEYADILRFKAAKQAAGWRAAHDEETKAVSALNDAVRLAEQNFSPVHPLAFDLRLAIAEIKAANHPDDAAADFAKLDKDMQDWMARDISAASNRFAAEASRALSDDFLFSYAAFASRHPKTQPAFADAAFRWASVENGKRDPLRRIARSLPPDDIGTRQLIRSGLHLSYLAQELFSSGDWDDFGQSVLDQINTFDAQLNQRLKAMPDFDRTALDTPMPPPEKLLGPDEALVSYFIVRKWKPDRQTENPYEETALYGLVARKDQPSRLMALGDPQSISRIGGEYQIAGLRGVPSGPERGAVSMTNLNIAFTDLHEQLITPLLGAIGDAKTLLVVPDGSLYSVPFSLLRDKQGQLVEEKFTLRMLARPDALYGIDTEQRMAADPKALLVGGLDYTNGGERGAAPLPGTLREVQDIAAILKDKGAEVDVVTGVDATEAVVRKDAEAATIAHFATHGSYESERTGGTAGVDTLWQSGIILSRSGDQRTMRRDDQDGRLYAFELMGWDLTKLELLVLSACETGRGDESFISGLRGLPTAVSISGAKRSLLALWPVDDAGTEQFMVRFYQHLVGGETYPEALRRTRRDAINGDLPAAKDPTVWAAFVMFEN